MAARPLAAAVALFAVVALARSSPEAQASPTALKILVVFADGANTNHTIQDLLSAQPGVATVDRFDAGVATPSLATLEGYDAIVTFSDTDYSDATTLGNNAADYADLGGIVIESDFNWTSLAHRQLGGRWASAGYSPYTVGATMVTSDPGVTLGTHDATSPLFSGITSISTRYRMDTSPTAGAVEVAKWSDGTTGVAFKGRAVGLNTCVADGCTPFSADLARLIVNAARMRAVGQLVTPNQGCQPDTFLQTHVASGDPYGVPSQGVLTNWYFRSGDPVLSALKLKVGRSAGLAGFAVTGESPGGAQTANQVNGPFPARIPVAGGDVVGLSTTGTGQCALQTPSASDQFVFQPGDIAPGTTTGVTAGSSSKFAIEAVVEPDDDGDVFGDMTQDRCPADPGSAQGCRKADLAITKTASTGSVQLGGQVTYTLTTTNRGPDIAPGVTVTDALPAGATLMSSSPSCSGATVVRCEAGVLPSGAKSVIQLVVTMTAAGSKTDTATVSSTPLRDASQAAAGAGDTNPANDSASVTTIVGLGKVVAARVSGASQSRGRWRATHRSKLAQASGRRAPVGTTFRFTLDKPAAIALRFTQRVPGRRVAGRCVRPTRKNARRAKCTRTVSRGTLRLQGRAGANSVRFFGWLGKKRKLRPGRYTLVIVASTTGAGTTSARLGFTILR